MAREKGRLREMGMEEPTHRQHEILEKVEAVGSIFKNDDSKDIKLCWELVRGGYLQNYVVMMGAFEWEFRLTEEAEKYLQESN